MRKTDLVPARAAPDQTDFLSQIRSGQPEGFILMMKQYNRLLYRIARSILNNDRDAEDVVQETYLKIFIHLDDIKNPAALKAWLARTATNEALGRLRHARHDMFLDDISDQRLKSGNIIPLYPNMSSDNPELTAARREMLHLIEDMVEKMPMIYRSVFMMRAIEGLTVEETAQCLAISPQTVKTRFHRARKILHQELDQAANELLSETFSFDGARCDRIIESVLEVMSKQK